MKKTCSNAKILTQNIKWSKNVNIKGIDTIPKSRESLGRKGMGPLRKNLDMPKAEVNTLREKVMTGKVESSEPAKPWMMGGKKPCVLKMIANEIWT